MLVNSPGHHLAPEARPGGSRPFGLPPRILKPANRLLEQQFWLWGCDIRRAEGNILAHLGFEKLKAPPATGLTISQYRVPLSITSTLALWGFGVCLSDDLEGSVFVPRAGLRPRFRCAAICTDAAWEPTWFERMPLPCSNGEVAASYRLTGQLIDWIAWYEGRVLEIAGPAYRQRSIEAWKRPIANAAPLADQWRDVGVVLQRHSLEQCPDAGPAAHS